MRSFFPFIATTALIFGLAGPLNAQPGKPVVQLKPVQETEEPRAGEKLRLSLRVSLPDGNHVQSDTPRDPAFIPTLLTIEAPDGITIDNIVYPKAVDLKQGEQTLAVFEREFVIGVRATVARNIEPGDWLLKAKLRYQACNDKSCFPPTTAETAWQLWIDKPRPAAQQHGDPFGRNARPFGGRMILTAAVATPAPTHDTIVAMVRAAMTDDFGHAEAMVKAYHRAHGPTPETLLAMSWLGRGALAQNDLDLAEHYAQQTYQFGVAELKRRGMDDESVFPTAFGASIEVLGQVMVARGQRGGATAFLAAELAKYGDTSLHNRLQKNINLISLQGAPAPELDTTEYLGARPAKLAELKGKVVLLFFWAHWCSDCKAQGPVLERLLHKYSSQGFTVVAPTQRFGYVANGVTASPVEEVRYIGQVRSQYYPWLANFPVTLSERNSERYGVSSTPTLALVDREGIIRLYNPGLMPEAKLDALIAKLVAEKA